MKKRIYGIIALLTIAISSCTSSESTKVLFNDNWEFAISEATFEQVESISDWEEVSLPHTPVITTKVMDGQWQGTCWYKKTFTLPESATNQVQILRFEGAMNVSEFWVNGEKVAMHYGGYLPAVFDFTDVAKVGENTIYVKLDNTDSKITGPKPMKILDFNMHGGLYRDAFLISKNPLHITDPILADKKASGGIFVTYPEVSKEAATVRVQTHIQNSDKKARTFTIINEILKDDKVIASQMTKKTTLEAGMDEEVSDEIVLENPDLWSPQTPSLYKVKTKLMVNGKAIDQEITTIGIRHIEFKGLDFYINGEKMFLRGVNRHQEYPYVGYAQGNNADYRDAVKIKEAGFDYIRLSHYPHSPAFMDACNEIGLLVLDAILGWQYYSRDSLFQQHVFETAHDLVRRDRNHPCVLAWEVSLNESWMDEPFIDRLHSIAHAEYPGDQCYTAGWQEYGYDIYLQARQHRQKHYKTPEKPYNVSEYGDWEYYAQNAGLNQDSWADLNEEERTSRQLLQHGEKRLLQQATNIQEAHNDNFNVPAFADGYWVMWDYNRGYSADLEASGIGSIDRLPKFSYYFYQSQRDASEVSELYQSGPMVFIASYWQNDSPLNVRIFSNAEEVELFLNGKSMGKQNPDTDKFSTNLNHPPFTFNLKKFEAGEIKAVAYIDGKEVASHSVRTPETPVALDIEIDESGKVPQSGVNDAVFVYASLKDENGTTVPLNNTEVKFSIEGDAQIVNPEAITTEAGIAAALIAIGSTKETISISASAEGLKTASIQISTK